MQSAQEPRQRARSPFVAAVLSLFFPGLGHAYAGAYHRALGFAAAPILLLALVAGVVFRADLTDLIGLALTPGVLPGIFLFNLIALGYRLVAIVDAYRVTAYLNAFDVGGRGRLGRPRGRQGAIPSARGRIPPVPSTSWITAPPGAIVLPPFDHLHAIGYRTNEPGPESQRTAMSLVGGGARTRRVPNPTL